MSVQLKHNDEETSWESHGYVRILDSDGKVLCEDVNYQHNSHGGWRDQDRTAGIVATVVASSKL